MNLFVKPTDIDSKYVFLAYAAIAGLSGLALLAWHPRPESMLCLAAACTAAGIATNADSDTRRRAAGWFALAHGLVVVAIATQEKRLGFPPTPAWEVNLLLAATLIFYYFWWNNGSVYRQPRPLQSLFGKTDPPAAPPRSRYDDQLRRAARQEERQRLARDLHDSVKQQLFVIQTAAATAQARFDGDSAGARDAIDQVRTAAREAIAEMEAMLEQLRAEPLENAGLVASLQKQCEALGFRTGAQVHLEIGTLPPNEHVPPGTQEALFRAAQEALANVARHARAKNVWVSLEAISGKLTLRVRDDGSGFDLNRPSAGMGISNMRARARDFDGEFEVLSREGEGTLVSLSMPYVAVQSRRYGRNAIAWGVGLAALIVLMNLRASLLSGWVVAFAALECARQTTAWWRTRGMEVTK